MSKKLISIRELIDVVERFEELRDELRLDMKVIGNKPKRNVVQKPTDVLVTSDTRTAEKKSAMKDPEDLSLFLRRSLRYLEIAEKQREATSVRALKLSWRSLIGQIALDLLEACELWKYSPGPELNSLFRELLNRGGNKRSESRKFTAREQAIYILAQQRIGVRKLAKILKVDASTISRWHQDLDFDERIERKTKWINALKRSGRWDELLRLSEEGESLLPVARRPVSES